MAGRQRDAAKQKSRPRITPQKPLPEESSESSEGATPVPGGTSLAGTRSWPTPETVAPSPKTRTSGGLAAHRSPRNVLELAVNSPLKCSFGNPDSRQPTGEP